MPGRWENISTLMLGEWAVGTQEERPGAWRGAVDGCRWGWESAALATLDMNSAIVNDFSCHQLAST
jgi:hypothetical protein